jgi:hypothetical protein
LVLAGLRFSIDLQRRDIAKFIGFKLEDTSFRLVHCDVAAQVHSEAKGRCLFLEWFDLREPGKEATTKPIELTIQQSLFRGEAAGLTVRPNACRLNVNQSVWHEVEQPIGIFPRVALVGQSVVVYLDRSTFVNAVEKGIIHVPGRNLGANAQEVGKPEIVAKNCLFLRTWHSPTPDPLVQVEMFTPQPSVAKESFVWKGMNNAHTAETRWGVVGPNVLFDTYEEWTMAFADCRQESFANGVDFVGAPPENAMTAALETWAMLPNHAFNKVASDRGPVGANIKRLGTGEPFDRALRRGEIMLP